ncbi:hypothetical protein ACS0TY_005772 [Phlomoides rotata]
MLLWVNKLHCSSACYLIIQKLGQTIHTHFHNVLQAVLKLHEVLLAKSTPVTDECTNPNWKYFKKLNEFDLIRTRKPIPASNGQLLRTIRLEYRMGLHNFGFNIYEVYACQKAQMYFYYGDNRWET